jgi:hypothetical protein
MLVEFTGRKGCVDRLESPSPSGVAIYGNCAFSRTSTPLVCSIWGLAKARGVDTRSAEARGILHIVLQALVNA